MRQLKCFKVKGKEDYICKIEEIIM